MGISQFHSGQLRYRYRSCDIDIAAAIPISQLRVLCVSRLGSAANLPASNDYVNLLLACRGVRLTSGLRVLCILFCRNQVERYAICQFLVCCMSYALPHFLVLSFALESWQCLIVVIAWFGVWLGWHTCRRWGCSYEGILSAPVRLMQ